MSAENPTKYISRTNYASIESSAENWHLSKDATTVLRATGKDPLVFNLIKDHLGREQLFVTKANNPEGNTEKLKAFLALNTDPMYKAKFEEHVGRTLVDSVYVTTEEGKDEEVIKKFKEDMGKDLSVRTLPEYPTKIVVRKHDDKVDLELDFANSEAHAIELGKPQA